MRERPILFAGSMVRAILEGTKTQTRRVLKHRHGWSIDSRSDGKPWPFFDPYVTGEPSSVEVPCPYGAPGNQLWVRETWGFDFAAVHAKRDVDGPFVYAADYPQKNRTLEGRWRPSIHMPRAASRITLTITDVRVERLQEISEDDARAEGVAKWAMVGIRDAVFPCEPYPQPHDEGTYRFGYQCLWDSLNAARGFGWDANPWVWVVTFERGATS